MRECESCELEVAKKDEIRCIKCKSAWHMKKKCMGMSRDFLEKNKHLQRNFRCNKCSGSDSDSEPEDDPEGRQRRDPATDSLLQVLKKFTDLDKKMDERMNQFQAVIEMFSSKIDEVTKLKSEVSRLTERVKALENAPRQNPEQHRDVVISNVPPMVDENPLVLAEKIFESLDAGLSKGDVQRALRFESKNGEYKRHFLKVQLASYEAKGKAIKTSRTVRATLGDLDLRSKFGKGFVDEESLEGNFLSSRIFVNEAISKPTKTILVAAVKLKKEGKIHTVWTYLDKVFVRLETKSKPIQINSESDLQGLLS